MRAEAVHPVVLPVGLVVTFVATSVSLAIWTLVRFAEKLASDESPEC
jgi:hypothetical protein